LFKTRTWSFIPFSIGCLGTTIVLNPRWI
jgi:hypothetical protein